MAGLARSPSAAGVDAALRRMLDVAVSAMALLVLAPLLLLLALVVRATSPGPALFVHRRVGRGGRPFGLVKLRTMRESGGATRREITPHDDPRITRAGALLRRTKLDELPQLWNVLRGEMSLVGPRPEVPVYLADLPDARRAALLAVRPGITDPASLAFRDEGALLASFSDPERAYRDEILPRKVELSLAYLARRTVLSDVVVLARTAWAVLGGRAADATPVAPPELERGGGPGAQPGLGGQVRSGVKWSAIAFYSDSLLRVGISIVLARLLSPTEFGLIALAMSLVGIFALVQESGMSAALVQHRGALDPAATAALYLTFGAGLLLAAATWLLAPWVAGLLEQPALATVLAPLSLLFLLHGLAHAPKALLQREMSFRALAATRLASTFTYGSVALALALTGHGVWSLVAGNLAAEAVLTVGSWLLCPWRPASARFDVAAARELAGFGRHIVGANLLALLRDKLPVLVVGKLLGADAVGLLWMAQRWAALPVEGVTYVVSRVSYPAFARLRDDRGRFAAGYATALEGILLVAAPAAIGLCLVAEPLVAALYDPRWAPAAPLLAILALYGLFHALAASTGEVFKAGGAPRLVLLYALLYVVALGVLLVALARPLGVVGVALAISGSAALVAAATLASALRLVGMPAAALARLAWLPLQGVTVMVAVVLLVERAASSADAPDGVRLFAGMATGAVAYAGVVLLRRPEWAACLRLPRRSAAAAAPRAGEEVA